MTEYNFNKNDSNRNDRAIDLFWVPLTTEIKIRKLKDNLIKSSPIPIKISRVDIFKSLEPLLDHMANNINVYGRFNNTKTNIIEIRKNKRRGIKIEYELW